MPAAPDAKTSFAAFDHRGFIRFVISRLLTVIAIEMVSVAVGWQVYGITHRPLQSPPGNGVCRLVKNSMLTVRIAVLLNGSRRGCANRPP
jgi:hypothetical protein